MKTFLGILFLCKIFSTRKYFKLENNFQFNMKIPGAGEAGELTAGGGGEVQPGEVACAGEQAGGLGGV